MSPVAGKSRFRNMSDIPTMQQHKASRADYWMHYEVMIAMLYQFSHVATDSCWRRTLRVAEAEPPE